MTQHDPYRPELPPPPFVPPFDPPGSQSPYIPEGSSTDDDSDGGDDSVTTGSSDDLGPRPDWWPEDWPWPPEPEEPVVLEAYPPIHTWPRLPPDHPYHIPLGYSPTSNCCTKTAASPRLERGRDKTMGKKKKPLTPKVKRMKRAARLAAARAWKVSYSGKNVLRGYCTHFAVDWRCAAVELQTLGVKLDPAYLARRERTEAEQSRKRMERKQKQQAETDQHWHPYTDSFAAHLAGDFEAMHDLELRQASIDEAERSDTVHHP